MQESNSSPVRLSDTSILLLMNRVPRLHQRLVAGKKEYSVMRQSVQDIAAALPTAKGFLVNHSRRLSAAQEQNWNMNARALFTQMIRAWITHQPLPAELQPL